MRWPFSLQRTMIDNVFIKYIVLVLLSMCFTAQVFGQTKPVVPLPIQATPLDSAAILQARYDSLVNYMMAHYGIDDNDTVEIPSAAPSTILSRKDTQTLAILTPPKEDKIANVTLALSTNFTTMPADTPKIKPNKPISEEPVPVDSFDFDDLSTEDLLVDTAESSADFADGDEADTQGDEEGEFDNLFTGYSDVSYWDMLRDPNFKFESAMIPADYHYPYDWDTVVINPYKISLAEMNDTILLKLRDSMDCSFHPPAIGDVTSGFGFRRWGKRPKFHYGIDVRMEVGDPVYSIFDGVVRVAKRSSDYGYVVLVRHYNGLETLYAHFDQLLAYPGKPVRSGEIIGLSGNTGRSTGPHLHFEVRYKGEKIDPSKVIYFPSGSLLSDTLQIDKHCFNHVRLYKAQQTKLRSRYYVVKRGDTLGKIAYKNGVTAKQIARLNRISSKTKLKPGRKLRIR